MLLRLLFSLLALAAMLPAAPLPVRGLHLNVPKPSDVPRMTKFIREVLPKEASILLSLRSTIVTSSRAIPKWLTPTRSVWTTLAL